MLWLSIICFFARLTHVFGVCVFSDDGEVGTVFAGVLVLGVVLVVVSGVVF